MFQNLLSLLFATTLSFGSPTADLSKDPEYFDDSALIEVSSIPFKRPEFVAPAPLSARAGIAIDLTSQTLLYEKNADLKVPIASLTKLMTAYIVLDENDPETVVTVSSNAAAKEGSQMGLSTGETITIKNLLYGLFISSGNDAAVALAETNAGSEAEFVKKMNATAERLGLEQTQFSNATGLDYGEGYSTPRDLVLLSAYLLRDPTVREIVKLPSADVPSESGQVHHVANTNLLLGQLGIKGLKTGKTPAAGECLIALAESPEGNEVLTVILGSQNRFGDSKVLIDWIYRAYVW
ncbi:MAG: D-alanyl-D-alanine carboxypeptidase family protein [Patescibacteria group bacterium]